MTNIFNKFFIKLFLVFICFYLIINPNVLINSVNYSINLFFNYIFPTLFPFFILSDLLINYNVCFYIGKLFKKVFGFLFNFGEEETFIYILSIFSGQPSNAKYVKDLLDKNIINIKNATILLSTSFFPSPIFIIGTIGYLFYNSLEVGVIILLSVYLANIVLGIILRKNYKPIVFIKRNSSFYPFGKIINKSIINSFNTIIIILGSIVIFITIINIICNIFSNNVFFNTLISSFLEITISSKKISLLNIPLNIKILLTTLVLSFGSLSVHTQVKSILYEYNIKYLTVLKNKIYTSIISLFICCLILFFIKLI